MSARILIRLLGAALVAVPGALVALPAGSAHASARVRVTNGSTGAQVDRTHMTTLRLQGSGFQSVRGGFGGIYVLFGTVGGNWRPSAHGNGLMAYVPDSQSKQNAGYQRFVAFPGGSTDSTANGGTVSAAGHWSTTLRVPGARFRAVGNDGRTHTVDCTKVTCGVITIGAHGVANARNETFTPVSVTDLAAPGQERGQSTVDPAADGTTAPSTGTAPAPGGKPRLRIDRASAAAGKVLGFTGSGLPPGRQVSAVFDDGEAGVGPLTVGASGELAAVIRLPAEVAPGTHELRLIGLAKPLQVRFAVAGALPADTPVRADAADSATSRPSAAALGFVGVAGALLVAALAYAIRVRRGKRRA